MATARASLRVDRRLLLVHGIVEGRRCQRGRRQKTGRALICGRKSGCANTLAVSPLGRPGNSWRGGDAPRVRLAGRGLRVLGRGARARAHGPGIHAGAVDGGY